MVKSDQNATFTSIVAALEQNMTFMVNKSINPTITPKHATAKPFCSMKLSRFMSVLYFRERKWLKE